MSSALVLRTAIGKHHHVQPLWEGTVRSDRIVLDMADIEPMPRVFRSMIRDLDFDICEMALATQALAYRYGKPLTALPIGLWRHFHHTRLLCLRGSELGGPEGLTGGTVGVRSYSQTTGVWLRGILQHEYGLDLNDTTWVTLEGAHVEEYKDPPEVVRAASGKGLRELLLTGEVDAVMGLRQANPEEVRPVFVDAEAAAEAWYRKSGVFPLNHIVAVKTELLKQYPWLTEEITALFTKAKVKAYEERVEDKPGSQDKLLKMVGDDPYPYGMERNRVATQMLLNFCAEQKLTPRAYEVDELFVS